MWCKITEDFKLEKKSQSKFDDDFTTEYNHCIKLTHGTVHIRLNNSYSICHDLCQDNFSIIIVCIALWLISLKVYKFKK